MKNFPHQFNQIPTLVEAMRVLESLIDNGQKIDDDGILGDALARARVYGFRKSDRSIEELLEEEHQKERGSQGTRTCARDLRRLFLLLNFLTEEKKLSQDAKRLIVLQGEPLCIEARIIWRAALDGMELSEGKGTSHPYRILLRLVSDHPGIKGYLLGLCLEANDDSDREYQRITDLITHSSLESLINALGITKSMANNSLKILPRLALQLGDVLESEEGYHLNQSALTIETSELSVVSSDLAIQTRRQFDPNRSHRGVYSEQSSHDRVVQRIFDPDLVEQRYQAHQSCLRRFYLLVPGSFEKYEDDYDLLVVGESQALLVEAKTIRNDEAKQIRLALGQLLYYEHFFVEPMYPGHKIFRFLITDAEPSPHLVHFLEKNLVGIAWFTPDNRFGQSPLSNRILDEFGVVLR